MVFIVDNLLTCWTLAFEVCVEVDDLPKDFNLTEIGKYFEMHLTADPIFLPFLLIFYCPCFVSDIILAMFLDYKKIMNLRVLSIEETQERHLTLIILK